MQVIGIYRVTVGHLVSTKYMYKNKYIKYYFSHNNSRQHLDFYTPLQNSGGVLWFHVGHPCVCPSVYPSICCTSVSPSMCITLVIRRLQVQSLPDPQHFFVEIDHEIFSMVIFSFQLIQEEQLSVSGEGMCTILVNH